MSLKPAIGSLLHVAFSSSSAICMYHSCYMKPQHQPLSNNYILKVACYDEEFGIYNDAGLLVSFRNFLFRGFTRLATQGLASPCAKKVPPKQPHPKLIKCTVAACLA